MGVLSGTLTIQGNSNGTFIMAATLAIIHRRTFSKKGDSFKSCELIYIETAALYPWKTEIIIHMEERF